MPEWLRWPRRRLERQQLMWLVAASLLWLCAVERQPPTRTDLIGAGLAVIGALVIIGFAERAR